MQFSPQGTCIGSLQWRKLSKHLGRELTSCNCSHSVNIRNENTPISHFPGKDLQFLPFSKVSRSFHQHLFKYQQSQSSTPHQRAASKKQAAPSSHYISLFDIAAFKLNSCLQFKGAPTSPSIKETIKHYAAYERIIRNEILIYRHTHGRM